MILLVGLGNPGRKYEKNRHNVGFFVANEVARANGLPDFREKFSGVFTKGTAWGADVVVLEPMTYMNDSGNCVQPAQTFHKVAIGDVIVVHDELDLPFGDVRVKKGGGHAGHNGLRSLIERLGSPDFVRIRVGIGRPPPGWKGDVADFVLADFDAVERATVPDLVARAVAAVERVIKDGPDAAMNAVNPKTPARNAKPKNTA